MSDPGGKVRNRRTPAGAEIGRKMAQWCDDAEPKARLLAPELPPRCASCAFRAASIWRTGRPRRR